MSEESSRASSGGKARAIKLTKEQRQAIGRKAAETRWGKSRKDKKSPTQDADPPPVPDPSTAPVAPKAKRNPMPKEFGKAYSVAEKRLAAALEERSAALQKLSALKEEIPSLVQIIRALGGQVNPQMIDTAADSLVQPMLGGNVFSPVPPTPPVHDPSLPPVPIARGGEMSFPGTPPPENPDIFLEQAEREMSEQGWR